MSNIPQAIVTKLVPISQLDRNYGVKCILYGAPGTGKTPVAATAPNTVILVTEPGTKSVRHLKNIPAWSGFTVKDIQEFFAWVAGSHDAKQFQTVIVDSISEMAEIFLKDAEAKNKHGLQAYGQMNENVYKICWDLFHLKDKHVILNGKEQVVDVGGVTKKRAYFPGKELNIKIPHLYDEILQLCKADIPGITGPQTAIRTIENFEAHARDRSGKLNELEPPNLANLIAKCLS